MHDIPSYSEADPVNRERHGLEVGDEVPAFGGTVEVVSVDEEGVEFSDGDTATHNTVCKNMADLELIGN